MWRPSRQPEQRLYDRLVKEQERRPNNPDWQQAELDALWQEARDYAQENGFPVLSVEAIRRAEHQGLGHVDYTSQWVNAVAAAIREEKARR